MRWELDVWWWDNYGFWIIPMSPMYYPLLFPSFLIAILRGCLIKFPKKLADKMIKVATCDKWGFTTPSRTAKMRRPHCFVPLMVCFSPSPQPAWLCWMNDTWSAGKLLFFSLIIDMYTHTHTHILPYCTQKRSRCGSLQSLWWINSS